MLILGNQQFIEAPFVNEAELEKVVVDNAELIFGSLSIYLDKALFHTPGGTGTIPDGFVVDLESKKWYIVEAELGHDSVWNHIAPQIAKQIIALT